MRVTKSHDVMSISRSWLHATRVQILLCKINASASEVLSVPHACFYYHTESALKVIQVLLV